jgi:LysM repeat protein
VDPGHRRELRRFGIPAAFLLAVTIAVLLIKAGLNNPDSQTTTAASPTTAPTVGTQTATTTTKLVLTGTAAATTTAPANAQYYVIQSGDTLGGLAARYNTTVEQLLTLNPALDPNALQPGTRIRVG